MWRLSARALFCAERQASSRWLHLFRSASFNASKTQTTWYGPRGTTWPGSHMPECGIGVRLGAERSQSALSQKQSQEIIPVSLLSLPVSWLLEARRRQASGRFPAQGTLGEGWEETTLWEEGLGLLTSSSLPSLSRIWGSSATFGLVPEAALWFDAEAGAEKNPK